MVHKIVRGTSIHVDREDAFDIGYRHGGYQMPHNNPHKVGTKRHKWYNDGYEDGKSDFESSKNESVDESEDEINELSRTTLNSYLKKSKNRSSDFQAAGDRENNQRKASKFYDRRDNTTDSRRDARNRLAGFYEPKRVSYGAASNESVELDEALPGVRGYWFGSTNNPDTHGISDGSTIKPKEKTELSPTWYHPDTPEGKAQIAKAAAKESKKNESVDLIKAIASNDTIASSQAFNSSLMSKISDLIDDRRQEVAQNMFAEERKLKTTHYGKSAEVYHDAEWGNHTVKYYKNGVHLNDEKIADTNHASLKAANIAAKKYINNSVNESKVPDGYHEEHHCPYCGDDHFDHEGAYCSKCKENHVQTVHVNDKNPNDVKDPHTGKQVHESTNISGITEGKGYLVAYDNDEAKNHFIDHILDHSGLSDNNPKLRTLHRGLSSINMKKQDDVIDAAVKAGIDKNSAKKAHAAISFQ